MTEDTGALRTMISMARESIEQARIEIAKSKEEYDEGINILLWLLAESKADAEKAKSEWAFELLNARLKNDEAKSRVNGLIHVNKELGLDYDKLRSKLYDREQERNVLLWLLAEARWQATYQTVPECDHTWWNVSVALAYTEKGNPDVDFGNTSPVIGKMCATCGERVINSHWGTIVTGFIDDWIN